MKKIIVSFLVVCLISMMGMVAFAADPATPWNDSSLKVAVLEKFDNLDNITGGIYGIGDDGTYNAVADAAGAKDHISLANGKLSFNAEAIAPHAWLGIADSKISFAGAEGFGFYVENNTGDVANISFKVANGGGNLNDAGNIGSGKPYTLIAADGTATVKTAANKDHSGNNVDSTYELPKDFKGYVCVPFTSLFACWTTNAFDVANVNSFGIEGGFPIDNIFVYGADVTEKDADLVLGGSQGTADVSTIAMAAAAVLSCGALVVVRKRK